MGISVNSVYQGDSDGLIPGKKVSTWLQYQSGKLPWIGVCEKGHSAEFWTDGGVWAVNPRSQLLSERTFGREYDGGQAECPGKEVL